MRRSWWRSGTVVAVAAGAVLGGGIPAADVAAPVSTAQVHNTTTTSTSALPAYATAGALFSGGRHFCSAAVVDSPAGDLVLTAAHCVSGGTDGLSFAPGYHDGAAPYGMWTVTRVFVPDGWAASADPDLDFAFLTVRQDGNPRTLESLTGAAKLGTGRGFVNEVTLAGYPDTTESPVVCRNTTTQFGTYQQRVACPGFPDGTSGGPWLTAHGSVIGVIGGYEQGGDTPDVSYSAYFDQDVQKLYETAVQGRE